MNDLRIRHGEATLMSHVQGTTESFKEALNWKLIDFARRCRFIRSFKSSWFETAEGAIFFEPGILEIEKFNAVEQTTFILRRKQSPTSQDMCTMRFSHHSVGEGDERHLILERCSETSIPVLWLSAVVYLLLKVTRWQTMFSLSIMHLIKKMDNSQNLSYQAGQTKGQAQEKGNQMMDKAGNAAQSAKETMQEAGQQMKDEAQGAADAVKDATGMNK